MKLCIVGVRGHTGYVLDGLDHTPQVRVVGVTTACEDPVGPLVDACEKAGQSPEVFDDYRGMLDSCQPDVLAVSGPFERHAEIVGEAFQRGIHVFCEKPVALTLEQLGTLRARHRVADVHFASMMGLRYDGAFYAAWRAVQDGAVGDVRLINTRKSYKLGDRAEFCRRRRTYGGTIPWVGSHAVDWILWYSQGRRFKTVFAAHSAQHNRGHGELEVSALCQFTLTDEVMASASIDYFRPDGAPSHGDDRVRVVGSEGVVEVTDSQTTLITDCGVEVLPAECDRQVFADFVAHVEGSREALIGAAETFAVTEACLRARQSADERRIVPFGEGQ